MKVLATGKITNAVGEPYLVAKYTKHKDIQSCHLLGARGLVPTALLPSPWQIMLAGYSSALSLGEDLAQQLSEVHGGADAHGVSQWAVVFPEVPQALDVCSLDNWQRSVGAHYPASVSLVVIWIEERSLLLALLPAMPSAFAQCLSLLPVAMLIR